MTAVRDWRASQPNEEGDQTSMTPDEEYEETDEDHWKIDEVLCGHPEFLLEEDFPKTPKMEE